MKKQINLFFDFEFTSLSPDAQPISLGIIANEYAIYKDLEYSKKGMEEAVKRLLNFGVYIPGMKSTEITCDLNINDWDKYKDYHKSSNYIGKYPIIDFMNNYCNKFNPHGVESVHLEKGKPIIKSKTFYAEFSNFDINRCDDWVKENVVNKLKCNTLKDFNKQSVHEFAKCYIETDEVPFCAYSKNRIEPNLFQWLSQFKDYEITFVCDCGTFDFYHLLQLIGKWEEGNVYSIDNLYEDNEIHSTISNKHGFDENQLKEQLNRFVGDNDIKKSIISRRFKNGLPKLPENISPVPQDLNDLIALKKGISVREAFDLDREELAFSESFDPKRKAKSVKYMQGDKWGDEKHNSLWDAKVIKVIYNKLYETLPI